MAPRIWDRGVERPGDSLGGSDAVTDGGGLERSLLAAHRFLRRGPVSEEGWSQLVAKDHRDWERSYQRPVGARQGRALDARRQLHRLVLLERVRQGRDRDLGVAGGGLPLDGRGHARVRAAGLSTGSVVLLVSVLAAAAEVPVRPRGACFRCSGRRERSVGDPVEAWTEIVEDPDKARLYRRQRGKGGFVRASWDEAVDMIAAAHVHTIRRYGPDRVVGFSPIPAMSMASYAAGEPLPVADRRDDPVVLRLVCGPAARLAPELRRSDRRPRVGRLVEAGYMIVWGATPTTRTPDAHFMTEARYRGQKVVVGLTRLRRAHEVRRSLAARGAGSDGALAMAMGHVILKEFYVDRQVPYFRATRGGSPTCRCS